MLLISTGAPPIFVIPTGAKRSGGIRLRSQNVSLQNPLVRAGLVTSFGMTDTMERFRRVFLGKFGRVGIRFTRFEQNSGISSPYHFRHAGEIILAGDGANPITTITILVRHAVTETDHRCDDMGGADIGDVEA